jgi:hypothetical protein
MTLRRWQPSHSLAILSFSLALMENNVVRPGFRVNPIPVNYPLFYCFKTRSHMKDSFLKA